MDKLNICLINDSFPPAIDGVANAVTNYAKIIQNGLGNSTVVTPFYPDADDSVFDFPVLEVSSTQIRRRLKEGLDCSQLLPEKVYQQILQQNLYRG